MNFNLKTLAFAATLALAAQAASAASFNFTGVVYFSAATPSLFGQTISGQFSYDDAAAALAGPDGSVNLLSLEVSFLGQTYSLPQAVADSAYAQFEAGLLLGPNAGFANVEGGFLQLQSNGFAYNFNEIDSLGDLTVSAVPEPSSWALSLAGILAVGALVRRRRLGA